jgi:uncharacterized membrane protein
VANRRPTPAEGLALAFAGAAVFLYPALAAQALQRWQPRGVAGVALAVLLGGLCWRRAADRDRGLAPSWAPSLALIALALATNQELPLLLFPALVNLQLAVAFGRTLARGPSMVERAATFLQPYLPDFTRPYCRRVTALWTLFFAGSALAIAWLALASPERWWPLYTTRIYFAILVAFSAAEFLVRKILFRNYGGGPIDRVFKALFPAHATERGRRSEAYLNEMRRLGLKTD